MKTLNPGDKIKLRRDAHLFSGWRGIATVISQYNESVTFRLPCGGIADALRYQVICVRRATK
jgi:hypothetical protein